MSLCEDAVRPRFYFCVVEPEVFTIANAAHQINEEIIDKEVRLIDDEGNQLGIMSQTRRGDEIIVGAECHIFLHEVGAVAVLSGVNMRQMPFPGAMPDAKMIEAAIRPDDIHEPPTALICLENALAGGTLVTIRLPASQ